MGEDRQIKNQLVITGASNNPGRVFVECLAVHPEEVAAAFPGGIVSVFRASSDTSHFDTQLPKARKVICDLKDIGALTKAFQQADTVFHIAGIHWSRELAVAASLCGVRRLIVVHTCGVYSKYKAAGEEYRRIDRFVRETCEQHGILLTVLRPTMIYGCSRDRNLIRLIRMADRLPFIPVVNGGYEALQPVHYADLGRSFFDVLIQERSTISKDFILSGEQPILFRDMLLSIGKTLGKPVRLMSCPYWIAYPAAWLLYLLTARKIDLREKIQRMCEPRAYGHEEAAAAFGFHPRSFESGIKDEIMAYLGNTESGQEA